MTVWMYMSCMHDEEKKQKKKRDAARVKEGRDTYTYTHTHTKAHLGPSFRGPFVQVLLTYFFETYLIQEI